MGMFDYITWEQRLPGLDTEPPIECQTKSLGCELSRYTVTADGQLLRAENITDDEFWRLVYDEGVAPEEAEERCRDEPDYSDPVPVTTSREVFFYVDGEHDFDAVFMNGRLVEVRQAKRTSLAADRKLAVIRELAEALEAAIRDR